MTKSPHLGPGLRLSRLCRWLFLAVLIKIGILTSLFLDVPITSFTNLLFPQIQSTLTGEAPATAQPTSNPTSRAVATGNALAASPGDTASTARPSSASQTPKPPLTSESLLRRQEELNLHEQDLRQLERQIDAKLTELQTLETRLQTMLKEADASRDEKLRHLVDVYTNMKARQAAEVIQTLDQGIAVKILSNMRGRQAGEILTFVRPEIAAKLSEALTRVQLPVDF